MGPKLLYVLFNIPMWMFSCSMFYEPQCTVLWITSLGRIEKAGGKSKNLGGSPNLTPNTPKALKLAFNLDLLLKPLSTQKLEMCLLPSLNT